MFDISLFFDPLKCWETYFEPWFNLYQAGSDMCAGIMDQARALTAPCQVVEKNLVQIEAAEGIPSEAKSALQKFESELLVVAKESDAKLMDKYFNKERPAFTTALANTILGIPEKDLLAYSRRMVDLMKQARYGYTEQVLAMKDRFGFHLDDGGYERIFVPGAEGMFQVYRVLKRDNQGRPIRTKPNRCRKPLLIIPPYVLGHHIAAFEPNEPGGANSYAHYLANQGVAVFIRIPEPILQFPLMQTMTLDSDILATRAICETLFDQSGGKPITLDCLCQGGTLGLYGQLSRRLQGVSDAIITHMTPQDGTMPSNLQRYMQELPQWYQKMALAYIRLDNGNVVFDGQVISMVFKLASMAENTPLAAFLRIVKLMEKGPLDKISAGLAYWLTHCIVPLPIGTVWPSFVSYVKPIMPDGTMPVKPFGEETNLFQLLDDGIHHLCCWSKHDRLVSPESARKHFLLLKDKLNGHTHVRLEESVYPTHHVGSLVDCTIVPDGPSPAQFHLQLEEKFFSSRYRKAS